MQFPFCGSVCLRHWHPEEAGIITPVSYPRKLNLGMMTQHRPGPPDSFPCVTHPRLFPCQLEVFWGNVILYLAVVPGGPLGTVPGRALATIQGSRLHGVLPGAPGVHGGIFGGQEEVTACSRALGSSVQTAKAPSPSSDAQSGLPHAITVGKAF